MASSQWRGESLARLLTWRLQTWTISCPHVPLCWQMFRQRLGFMAEIWPVPGEDRATSAICETRHSGGNESKQIEPKKNRRV